MSKIRICDCCGKKVKDGEYNIVKIEGEKDRLDLCESCIADLKSGNKNTVKFIIKEYHPYPYLPMIEYPEPYSAIGCGKHFALGALYNIRGKPETRIMKALKTSAFFDPFVREPFMIEVLEYEENEKDELEADV